MAEIWKLGFALPARRAEGGAHLDTLGVLLEFVMSMGWTRASLIAQQLADAIVWMLQRHVAKALEGYVEEQKRRRPAFAKLWAKREAIRHDDYGSHARLQEALQYTDDMFSGMVGPTVAATTIICFCRLIGPAQHVSADAADAARGTARRHMVALRRDQLVRGVPRKRRGEIRAMARTQQERRGESIVSGARDGPGGNPFNGPNALEATRGFACLIACGEQRCDVRDVANLSQITVHEAQAVRTQDGLWKWMRQLQHRVGELGENVTVRCGCMGAVNGDPCHCAIICLHAEQQLDIAEDIARPASGPRAQGSHAGARTQHGGRRRAQVAPWRRSHMDRVRDLGHASAHVGAAAQGSGATARHNKHTRWELRRRSVPKFCWHATGRPQNNGRRILPHKRALRAILRRRRARRGSQHACAHAQTDAGAPEKLAARARQLPRRVHAGLCSRARCGA